MSLFCTLHSKGVKDIDFSMDFIAENLNKLQNLGLEGKIN